jgi:hypothetical protein
MVGVCRVVFLLGSREEGGRGKKTLSYLLDSGVLEVKGLVCACVCEWLQCYGVKAEVIGIFRSIGRRVWYVR